MIRLNSGLIGLGALTPNDIMVFWETDITAKLKCQWDFKTQLECNDCSWTGTSSPFQVNAKRRPCALYEISAPRRGDFKGVQPLRQGSTSPSLIVMSFPIAEAEGYLHTGFVLVVLAQRERA